MATRTWNGGTGVATQVDTLTIANTWANGDTMTTTMTAEDTSTQTVNTVVTSGTLETDRDEHLADLQASTQSLFAAITWAASSTDKITATAKVSGVPFYCAASETTAGDGTWARAATDANAGPNDWNTAANWSGSTVPVDSDDVWFDGIGDDASDDALYGLDQSAIQLTTLQITGGYTGAIGQTANGYYLIIDSTTTSFESGGNATWLNGRLVAINVTGGAGGPNMLQLDGDIDNLRVLSSGAGGTVTIKNSTVLDNVYVNSAPNVKVVIGTSVSSLDLIDATTGSVSCDSACVTINCGGSAVVAHTTGAVTTANMRGGILKYNGSGTLTTANIFEGLLSLLENYTTAVTITTVNSYGGVVNSANGLGNVTISNKNEFGGGQILT